MLLDQDPIGNHLSSSQARVVYNLFRLQFYIQQCIAKTWLFNCLSFFYLLGVEVAERFAYCGMNLN